MHNLELVIDIWKLQYYVDFALLDSPQEQIEFIKYLLRENKIRITELEKENLTLVESQTDRSTLEDLQELFLSKLKIARKRLEVLPTFETHDAQYIPTDLSSETTPKRKPHTFFIAHQKNIGIPRRKAWINFKSLGT